VGVDHGGADVEELRSEWRVTRFVRGRPRSQLWTARGTTGLLSRSRPPNRATERRRRLLCVDFPTGRPGRPIVARRSPVRDAPSIRGRAVAWTAPRRMRETEMEGRGGVAPPFLLPAIDGLADLGGHLLVAADRPACRRPIARHRRPTRSSRHPTRWSWSTHPLVTAP